MPSILDIQQDAQDVVRFSTVGLGTLNKLKLDTITYNIVDKDGAVKRSYEGRDNRQAAYDDADNSNFAEEEGAPFHVEAKSNLGIDPETGALDFVVGSQVGILFPTDEINAAADAITAAVDCAIIEDMIKREIQSLVDQLKTKATAAGDLSPFNVLTDIPSDPLKIISWVKKFVSLYISPQILAMIDLAIQLALLAAAVQKIIQAAQAAQETITLCAASITDTAIDSLIESSLDALGTSEAKINTILQDVSTVQSKISTITGKPAKFQTGSIEQLIESATTENRAAFISDVNEYAIASLSEPETALSANGLNSISSSIGPGLAANSTLAIQSLTSANAYSNTTTFTVGANTFKFKNGILEDVL